MNKSIYTEAVNDTAIKGLTDFLKSVSDLVEIEGWSKMKADEKRANMTEALGQSMELRKRFVDFYAKQTGNEQNWTDWEAGDAPTTETAETAETTAEEPTSDADNIPDAETVETEEPFVAQPGSAVGMPAAHGTFVEGGFELMKSDVVGLDAQNSHVALLSAEENLEFEHLRIGVLLSHISSKQHYLTLGHENMRAYLAAETNLGYRHGVQLIQNANKVAELNIPAEDLKGVSWSALRHVLPVLNSTNYKTWLKAAASMKHVALIDAVKDEKVKQAGALPAPETTTPKPETKPKTFQLDPAATELVNQAVEKAKVAGNVETTGKALEIIAADYTGKPIQTVPGPDTSEKGLMDMLTKIRSEEGMDGLIRLLGAVEQVWPEPDISVNLQPDAEAAE